MANQLYNLNADTQSISSQLYGLGSTQEDSEAYMRKERDQKLLDMKMAHLQDALASKSAKFGFDTTASLQQNLSNAIDEQVYTNPDGSMYQLIYSKDPTGSTVVTQLPFTGETRNLYIDNTVAGDFKLGLARSDTKAGITPFEARYSDSTETSPYINGGKGYDGTPGVLGVTPKDKALLDIKLPYNYATQFEYGVHSDIDQIKHRAIGTQPVNKIDELLYGSGKTEYTTKDAPMWNDAVTEGELVTRNTPLPHDPKMFDNRYTSQVTPASAYDEFSTMDALGMTPSAVAKSALNVSSKGAQVYAKGAELMYTASEKLGDYLQKLAEYTGNKPREENILQTIGKYGQSSTQKLQKEQSDFRGSAAINDVVGYDPSIVQEYGKIFKDAVKSGDYSEAIVSRVHPAAILAFSESSVDSALNMSAAGLGSNMVLNMNDALFKLHESAAKENRQPTAREISTSAGLSITATGLDALGDRLMLGGKILPSSTSAAVATQIDTLKTAIGGMLPDVQSEVLKVFGTKLAAIGISGAEFAGRTAGETITEPIQTILEGKASDVNKMNLNVTPAELDEALEAAGVAMGAGGVGAAPSTSYDALKSVKDIGVSAVSGISDVVSAKMDANELQQNQSATVIQDISKSRPDIAATHEATMNSIKEQSLRPDIDIGPVDLASYTAGALGVNAQLNDIAAEGQVELAEAVSSGKVSPELATGIDREAASFDTMYANLVEQIGVGFKTIEEAPAGTYNFTQDEVVDDVKGLVSESIKGSTEAENAFVGLLGFKDRLVNAAGGNTELVKNKLNVIDQKINNLMPIFQAQTTEQIKAILADEKITTATKVAKVIGSSAASLEDIKVLEQSKDLTPEAKTILEVKKQVLKSQDDVADEKMFGGGKRNSTMQWASLLLSQANNPAAVKDSMEHIYNFYDGQQAKIDTLRAAVAEWDAEKSMPWVTEPINAKTNESYTETEKAGIRSGVGSDNKITINGTKYNVTAADSFANKVEREQEVIGTLVTLGEQLVGGRGTDVSSAQSNIKVPTAYKDVSGEEVAVKGVKEVVEAPAVDIVQEALSLTEQIYVTSTQGNTKTDSYKNLVNKLVSIINTVDDLPVTAEVVNDIDKALTKDNILSNSLKKVNTLVNRIVSGSPLLKSHETTLNKLLPLILKEQKTGVGNEVTKSGVNVQADRLKASNKDNTPIGGSEDAQGDVRINVLKKEYSPLARYKSYDVDDIAKEQRAYEENEVAIKADKESEADTATPVKKEAMKDAIIPDNIKEHAAVIASAAERSAELTDEIQSLFKDMQTAEGKALNDLLCGIKG